MRWVALVVAVVTAPACAGWVPAVQVSVLATRSERRGPTASGESWGTSATVVLSWRDALEVAEPEPGLEGE